MLSRDIAGVVQTPSTALLQHELLDPGPGPDSSSHIVKRSVLHRSARSFIETSDSVLATLEVLFSVKGRVAASLLAGFARQRYREKKSLWLRRTGKPDLATLTASNTPPYLNCSVVRFLSKVSAML